LGPRIGQGLPRPARNGSRVLARRMRQDLPSGKDLLAKNVMVKGETVSYTPRL
jgi:hypothetical protein